MQSLITCGGCGKFWSGAGRAHCAAKGCHETFSCDSAADKHRTGTFGVDRHCMDPATAGLVPHEKPWGVLWSHPGPVDGYRPGGVRGNMDADVDHTE